MSDPIVDAVHADPVVQAVLATDQSAGQRKTVTTQAGNLVAAPTTSEEQDRSTAGQRHINVMWEGTQRNIAQEVTIVALTVTAFLVMWPGIPLELRLMAYTTLSNVFFAVTSVYFTRTNHTKVGGVLPQQAGR